MADTKGVVRSPATVVVLSIVTCGIYSLYWLYTFSSEIKGYLGKEEINPVMDLILSIVFFPYMFYWVYKNGQFIAEAQAKAGLPATDESILYVVLSFVGLSIVAMAIMQSKVNLIWEK